METCVYRSLARATKIDLDQRVFRQVNVSPVARKEEHEGRPESHVPRRICNCGVAHRRADRANGSFGNIVGNLSDCVCITQVDQAIYDSRLASVQRAFFVESEASLRRGLRSAQRATDTKRLPVNWHDPVHAKIKAP